MEFFLQILIVGVIATIAMDIWSWLLSAVFKSVHPSNWALVGRWVGHIFKGTFFHKPNIMESDAINHENALGWVFHYFTGFVYSGAYLLFIFSVLNGEPSLLSAFLFGVITLVAPWFIMSPGFGFGICGRLTPVMKSKLIQSFAGHSIFGIALYFAWELSKPLFI